MVQWDTGDSPSAGGASSLCAALGPVRSPRTASFAWLAEHSHEISFPQARSA